MPSEQPGFLQRHGVALVSLSLALTSLCYTTWRNETTERHRNVRQAAFRSLEEIGELQTIVNAHYRTGMPHADLVGGWGRVALIHDLCGLLPPPSPAAGERLLAVWRQDADAWASGDTAAAEDRIDTAIADTRAALLDNLHSLH